MQLHRHCAYFTFPGDVLTVTAGDCEFLFFWVVRRCLLLLLLYFFVNCRLLRPFTIVILKDLFTHPPTIPLAIVGKTTRDWSVSGPMYFYIIYILYIAYIYIKNLRVKGNPIFVIRLIQRLLGYLVLWGASGLFMSIIVSYHNLCFCVTKREKILASPFIWWM